MRYESPAALRDALEARLVREAEERNRDLQWLRKRVVFERMLTRLESAEPGKWVLKGGMGIEVRLRGRTRATKDLDLALRDERLDGEAIRDELIEVLATDPDGDWFLFAVGNTKVLTADEAGRSGWRYPVTCSLAGRPFDSVRVDVVSRPEEVTRTERLPLPSTLAFAGLLPREVEVVDPRQQFAEKLHALTRAYHGDRATSRARDLVDLVVLIEEDWVEAQDIFDACNLVFGSRDTHPLPDEFPDPPAGLRDDYERIANEVEVSTRAFRDAVTRVREFWNEALRQRGE